MKRLLGIVLISVLPLYQWAQCAMCQATAESSRDAGSTAAEGLNKGVLYILFMPIIFAVLMFIIWKRREHFLKQYEESQESYS